MPWQFFLLFAFVEHRSAGASGRQGGEHKVFKNRAKREREAKWNWDICLSAVHGRGLNNGEEEKEEQGLAGYHRNGIIGLIMPIAHLNLQPRWWGWWYWLLLLRKAQGSWYPQPYGVLGATAVRSCERGVRKTCGQLTNVTRKSLFCPLAISMIIFTLGLRCCVLINTSIKQA